MAKSLTERKKISTTQVFGIAFLVSLCIIALLGVLYASTSHDAKVLKKMKIFDLSGSTQTLTVDNMLLEYNGKEILFGGGSFQYFGKAKDITACSYIVSAQEKGKDKQILISDPITDTNKEGLNLSAPVLMGTFTNDEGLSPLKMKEFPDKYAISVQVVLTTRTGTVTEEVYLKATEMNMEFFRNTP